MSTLVVLGVVLMAVVGVLHLALDQPDQPDQPATVRPRAVRGRSGRAAAPVAGDDVVLVPLLVDLSTPPATRVRSAVTLMVLVAVLGAAMALLVATVVVGAARVVSGSLA